MKPHKRLPGAGNGLLSDLWYRDEVPAIPLDIPWSKQDPFLKEAIIARALLGDAPGKNRVKA